MSKHQTLLIEGTEIVLYTGERDYYVSTTDIARHQDGRPYQKLDADWGYHQLPR
jgi:hypothetical protein